jgi:hypothetical protein
MKLSFPVRHSLKVPTVGPKSLIGNPLFSIPKAFGTGSRVKSEADDFLLYTPTLINTFIKILTASHPG